MLVNALRKYREDGYENLTFTILQAYNANNDEEILKQHDNFVQEGYEGIMIRKYAGLNASLKKKKNRNIDLIVRTIY